MRVICKKDSDSTLKLNTLKYFCVFSLPKHREQTKAVNYVEEKGYGPDFAETKDILTLIYKLENIKPKADSGPCLKLITYQPCQMAATINVIEIFSDLYAV